MAQRGGPPAAGGMSTAKIGDRAYEKLEKTSAEFFAITYGSLVRQMCLDTGDNAEAVNTQLDAMGERIGVRLVEEYAVRCGAPPCRSAAQAAENAAKIGLRAFLGIIASVEAIDGPAPAASSSNSQTFAIVFDENPLNLFVELPDAFRGTLWYSNVLCGVLRGALQQVGMLVQATYVRDILRGDDANEIRLQFFGKEKETFKVDMQK